MATTRQLTANIRISFEIRDRLNGFGKKGETYDEIIESLLERK